MTTSKTALHHISVRRTHFHRDTIDPLRINVRISTKRFAKLFGNSREYVHKK